MATTQKPKGATASPQAAAPKPQNAGQQKQSAEVFVLPGSKKSLQQVRFDKIIVQEDTYAFREGSGSNPFSEKALQPLREEIMEYGGIHVPILLRDLGNGTYLLIDGHRRLLFGQAIDRKEGGGLHGRHVAAGQRLGCREQANLSRSRRGFRPTFTANRWPMKAG